MTQKTLHIPQLSALRFFIVLSIVIWHYGRQLYPLNTNYLFRTQYGNMAVDLFFILSGFVLTIGNYHKTIKPLLFYADRFAKIYPVYFLTLLYYLIFSHDGIFFHTFQPMAFIAHLLLLQAWIPNITMSFNTPAWFLSVIVFFYALFPYINNRIKNVHTGKLALMTVLIWAASSALVTHLINMYSSPSRTFEAFTYYNPFLHFNAFLMGICGGILYLRRNKKSANDFWLSATGIIISVGVLSSIFIMDIPAIRTIHSSAYNPLLLLFIYSFSVNKTAFTSFLSHTFFFRLGDISFAMYLLQKPAMAIYRLILNHYNVTINFFTLFVYLIVLTAVSYILYIVYEKPLRPLILSYFASRRLISG